MPAAQLEIPVTGSALIVVPWRDAVVDSIGYDPRSQYVELFWLGVLGPTATWILRRLASGLDEFPDGYELDLAETAAAMGLAYNEGTNNPFMRALGRCVLFGVAQPSSHQLAVRRLLPPVATRHLLRMPTHLQQLHEAWRQHTARTGDATLRRACALAGTMFASGDDADLVERQLLRLGVAPAAASRATAQAWQRLGSPDAA